jgi:TNF receptor-associated protein 1
MSAEHEQIYYLLAPSRDTALSSAYMEALKAKDLEVLLLYSTVDEFVMTNLMSYAGKSLVSAEQAKLSVASDDTEGADALGGEEADELKKWLAETVPGVREVELSSRLVDSPAIVVGHESASMRRVMSMVESGVAPQLPPQKLEINGKHPIIRQLATLRTSNADLANVVARQVFSNALISAGLLDDPRTMLTDINQILEHASRG